MHVCRKFRSGAAAKGREQRRPNAGANGARRARELMPADEVAAPDADLDLGVAEARAAKLVAMDHPVMARGEDPGPRVGTHR